MPAAEHADVVVVGAGVIGSSIALALARRGHQVTVVDKAGGPGHGSTSASSAIVRFNYSTRDGVALAWESKHCWEAWSEHLGHVDATGLAQFRRTGLVMLDVPIAPREPMLELFDDVGVPYEQWNAQTLRARVPGIDAGRFWPPKPVDEDAFWEPADGELGAFFTPDAGYVDDPMLAAHNLAEAARHNGARFMFHAVVTAVVRADHVAGVTLADGTTVASPVVINSAGPWSTSLNRLAGVGDDFTVEVRPLRQEVDQVPAADGADLPVVADLDLGIYIRPSTGHSLLVGGTEPACDPLQWVDDPDAVDLRLTRAVSRAQVLRASRRLPALAVPDPPAGVVGVYDAADDWTPIYDRTDLDGYYVAMGTSGNQFKNAPVVGELMAALVESVESGHDHDRDPVRFTCAHTGQVLDLGSFSRRRKRNAASSGTVLG